MALENVFSWSKSTDETFRECPRKYFYHRYASWGGWDASSPPRTRLAYVLKNLKNRYAWKGETVHHVIEHVMKSLRSGTPIPLETAQAHLTKLMRENYRSSKTKKYMQDPKKSYGLFEHEYEKGITDDVWKSFHDGAAECLANFYKSPLFVQLSTDDKKTWLLIEDLEEFDFEGSKVYVKLDFARRQDGNVEIFDWKTGKTEGGSPVQIGAYALYAMQKWNVPVGNVRAYLVGLGRPPVSMQEQTVDDALLAATRAIMRESIAGMRSMLTDPRKNLPKPEAEFPFTENERFCTNCNFHKICERFAPAPAPASAAK